MGLRGPRGGRVRLGRVWFIEESDETTGVEWDIAVDESGQRIWNGVLKW